MGLNSDGHMDAMVETLEKEKAAGNIPVLNEEVEAASRALDALIPDDEIQTNDAIQASSGVSLGIKLDEAESNLTLLIQGGGFICEHGLSLPNTAKAFESDLVPEISSRAIKVLHKSPWGQKALMFLSADLKQDELALLLAVYKFGNVVYGAYQLDVEAQKEAKAKKEAVNAN